MHLSITHQTQYIYEDDVNYTIQSLRLTPQSFSAQNVISWDLTVPNKETATMFTDCFGNRALTLTITEPHKDVNIKVEGMVETKDCNGVVSGLAEIAPLSVYLRKTELTNADENIIELAHQAKCDDILDTLHTLNGLTLEHVSYERGATNSETTASEAFKLGKGVCQDHTHIFITAARSLNIPARYVTGYVLVEKDEDNAHHAWAEAYIPGLGWVGFDVSNQLCPTEHYVRLACGLDAGYTAPIRGASQSGQKGALSVSVDVQQKQVSQ